MARPRPGTAASTAAGHSAGDALGAAARGAARGGEELGEEGTLPTAKGGALVRVPQRVL